MHVCSSQFNSSPFLLVGHSNPGSLMPTGVFLFVVLGFCIVGVRILTSDINHPFLGL